MAILRTNGFVQLRRGLQEHVADGSMTIYEAWIFISILFNADPKTGVWIGSAASLAKLFPINTRYCQRALARLESKEYLKRFQSPGRNGCFPIAIHNFECTDGSLRGKRLNALDSEKYEDLIYSSVAEMSEVGTEVGTQVGTEVGTPLYRNGEQKLDKREKNSSRGKREIDPRHTPFRNAIAAYWKHRNPVTPELPWSARDAKALAEILAASPTLTLEQFQTLLQNRSKQITSHGDPVYLWIAKIHNYNQPGGTNGKQGPAIERQSRTADNIRDIAIASGDYPVGQDIAEDGDLLPKSRAEQGNFERVPKRFQGPGAVARHGGC